MLIYGRMQTRPVSSDCSLIEQAILNRYPLILVECEDKLDSHLVRLRLRPHFPAQEVRLTTQDLSDDSWKERVDSAVRTLHAM